MNRFVLSAHDLTPKKPSLESTEDITITDRVLHALNSSGTSGDESQKHTFLSNLHPENVEETKEPQPMVARFHTKGRRSSPIKIMKRAVNNVHLDMSDAGFGGESKEEEKSLANSKKFERALDQLEAAFNREDEENENSINQLENPRSPGFVDNYDDLRRIDSRARYNSGGKLKNSPADGRKEAFAEEFVTVNQVVGSQADLENIVDEVISEDENSFRDSGLVGTTRINLLVKEKGL